MREGRARQAKVIELVRPAADRPDVPPADGAKKVVEASQAAIDALPPDSGEWKVKGILGLLVWRGKSATSFRLVRRVHSRLVKRTLSAQSLAEARREAIRVWKSLTPRPPEARPAPTLEEAIEAYVSGKRLAERTREDYRYMIRHYLPDWLNRRLDALAADRAAFRKRMSEIERKHGAAAAALLVRVYRALHNWHRKVLPDLPESPTIACETPRVKARDWAMSDEELRKWWARVRELSAGKRAWYLAALMTGARAGSVTMLKWGDVEFEKRLIRFRVVKGDRPYVIPMPEILARILAEYRENDWLPNEEGWVFPSPYKRGAPLFSQVKNRGIVSPHHLRHTMRTRLAAAGCPPDLARVALGHSLGQNVSERYITASLLVEAVRPYMEKVAQEYSEILGLDAVNV